MRKKGFKRFLKENILESEGSNKIKSLSVTAGVFVGLLPLWGFQTVIILFLATYFKLNKFLSYVSTHVSFPLFLPFIIALSLFIGGHFVGGETHFETASMNMKFVKAHLLQYIIGSLILAVISSAFCGLLTYFFLEIFKTKKLKIIK